MSVIQNSHSNPVSTYRAVSSVYHGKQGSPPILSIPAAVLNLIAQMLVEQRAALPLSFACKATRKLDGLKKDNLIYEKYRNVIESAIERSHFSIAIWLHDHLRYPLTTGAFSAAVARNNRSLLHWLWGNHCPLDGWTCIAAARGGHLDLLQWARANGCPLDKSQLGFSATYGGKLNVLLWTLAQGCSFDEIHLYSAASKGHLAILKWAHAQG